MWSSNDQADFICKGEEDIFRGRCCKTVDVSCLSPRKNRSKVVFCGCRVWSVRYNHFHDQLLLSSSSDSRVILNNIVSLSSEPFGHLDEEEEEDGRQEKG